MNATYMCPTEGDGEVVHRYVAGTLEPPAVDAFEVHLLACPACQRAVEDGAAVSAALRSGRGRVRRSPLRWIVPLTAAAAVGLWLLLPAGDPLARLARVDRVPGFDGLPVRAAPDSATALADRGMVAYRDGDFAGAAELFEAAVSLEPSPAVQFFLGIARLKVGAAPAAVSALRAALEPAGNPYASEARLYLAKAWLALGDADSALAQLAAVPQGAGPVRAHASALADSVQNVLMR